MEVLKNYPEIFKPETVTRQVFFKLYAQVCTRCFGWGLPNTSMVPMADNCNHSDVTVVQELINHDLHITSASQYYTRSKFMNNVAECFDGKDSELLKGQFDRELHEKHLIEYGPESWKERTLSQDIWTIPFIKDTYDEDNDTSEEEEEEEEEN